LRAGTTLDPVADPKVSALIASRPCHDAHRAALTKASPESSLAVDARTPRSPSIRNLSLSFSASRTYLSEMVIEHLVLSVPLALQPRFMQTDAVVWTATLAAQPGFLGKETWAEAADPDKLHLIIRWQSRAAWHAIPPALLAETDARMTAAFGQPCAVISCADYDVL
jgi:uncharacterized protein (TIGR03792 family)